MKEELKSYLLSQGAYDVGFCKLNEEISGMNFAISIVFKLSESIIDEIDAAPTHTYFNHYRTVNAHLDRLGLLCGIYLDKKGYKYITVAASQTVEKNIVPKGRVSHKEIAVLSGLGSIGKNALFLHKQYGSNVRLCTVLCDCDFGENELVVYDLCSGCNECVKKCPANCLYGEKFDINDPKKPLLDVKACSEYMKNNFQHIGRGSVCGICIKHCKPRQIMI